MIDDMTVPKRDLNKKGLPSNFQPAKKSGMFKTIIRTPTEAEGNMKLIINAIPETPPGAILLGSRKMTRPKA
jgi:hypothetical protein